MNYSTAVFLINPNARAVYATYEEGEKAPKTLFKTLDPGIKIDDLVIVPTDTRHKMTVVKVVEVDVDFDLDTTINIPWIIGPVDRAAFDKTLAAEQQAIQAIKSAELRKKRDDLRAALLVDQEALKSLPITSMGGTPALPAE